jgi:hypothetical protein
MASRIVCAPALSDTSAGVRFTISNRPSVSTAAGGAAAGIASAVRVSARASARAPGSNAEVSVQVAR